MTRRSLKLALRAHAQDLLALALFIAGVSVYHWRGIAPGQTFLPVDLTQNTEPWVTRTRALQNWLISDPIYEFYPHLTHAVSTIRNTAAWPLWTAGRFLGHPVMGDPTMQPFYPLFIGLGLILGAARGLAIGVWLHVLLAGILTYGFLRTLRCDWRAALLGAFTYALSGYLITWLETLFFVATMAWLPGVLWMFELALQRRNVAYAALAGAALGMAALGGEFQFLITFCLFLGLYALGRTWEDSRMRAVRPGWPLLMLAVTLVVGGLLGAIQEVPFAEFLSLTRRTIEHGLQVGLPWRQLVTLVVPNFFGNPAAAAGVQYWGQSNYSEFTIYGGLVALLLACAAPLSSRRFQIRYLFALGLVMVYFILGGPGVSALGTLPLLKYGSLARSAFILPLLLGTLAALGLSEPQLRPRAVLVVAALLILWVAVAWQQNWQGVQSHRLLVSRSLLNAAGLLGAATLLLLLRARRPGLRPLVDLGLVALVFYDLLLFGQRFNPTGPVARLMPKTPVIDFLQAKAKGQIVIPLQRGNLLFGPNVLSLYDIAEAGGYSSFVNSRFHQLVAAADPKIDIWWMQREGNMIVLSYPTRRLLDLLRVSYLVSARSLGEPEIYAEQVIDRCDAGSGEIAAAHPVSGTFTVRAAAINRLDLRMRSLPASRPGRTLVVRLWRDAQRNDLAAEMRRELAPADHDQTLTFFFAPERNAPGQTYAWEVSTPEAAPTGLAICTDTRGRPSVSVYGAEGHEAYAGELFVFERFAPLPRAYVAYAAETITDDNVATARLLDDSFDVRNVVVTAGPTGLRAAADIPATRAQVTEDADTRVAVHVEAVRDGMLVLDDQYHPGWHALVDGRPATVQRVNQFMRGVALQAGKHEVVFSFAPTSLKVGGALSLLGLAICVALVLIGSRKSNN